MQNFPRGFGQVVVAHWPIGCTEIDCLREDLFLPAAGTDRLIIEPHGRIDLRVFIEPLGVNRIWKRRAGAIDHHLRGCGRAHSKCECESEENFRPVGFRHTTKLPQPNSGGQNLYCYVCVTTGRTMRIVVPFSISLSASTWPPWSCAMCFTIARPRPVPRTLLAVRALSTR